MMDHATSMKPIRFVMLGGFLGAGKTTTLLRLAAHYAGQGLRVGVITNDQADSLVDTLAFRSAGFATEEIPAGCFCCHFEKLLEASGRLADGMEPDVILAEPVGSCTDLVNAVVTPLRKVYSDRFDVAPYAVVLDPERALDALTGRGPRGFSRQVTYIYKMQQSEADIVVVNKIDRLSPVALETVMQLVRQHFPNALHHQISAQSGEGFPELARLLATSEPPGRNPATVDYAVYTEGEAALGWLNARVQIMAQHVWDGNQTLEALARRIQSTLAESDAEIAHFKMRLRDAHGREASVHATSSERDCEMSLRLDAPLSAGELLINLRAEAGPDLLRSVVLEALNAEASLRTLAHEVVSCEAFAPSPPVPPPPNRSLVRL